MNYSLGSYVPVHPMHNTCEGLQHSIETGKQGGSIIRPVSSDATKPESEEVAVNIAYLPCKNTLF